MTENNYFGDKGDGGSYFTNPSTPSVAATAETLVPQEAVIQPNPVEDALKAYTKSSHKLVIKRYAIKRT